MAVICINECNADGCYEKVVKGKFFCKEHQKQFDGGSTIKAFYGKKVKKTKGQSVNLSFRELEVRRYK